jgi:hypothetical protein
MSTPLLSAGKRLTGLATCCATASVLDTQVPALQA